MKNIKLITVASSLLLFSCASMTMDDEIYEKKITALSEDRCNSEFIKGRDYSVVKYLNEDGGDDIVEIQIPDIPGVFIASLDEWEGRNPVQKKDQAKDNVSFRNCTDKELAYFKDTYSPPSQTKNTLFIIGGVGLLAILAEAAGGGSGSGDGTSQADQPGTTVSFPNP